MKSLRVAILLWAFSCLYSCAPSRYVRPLEKKQQVASLSFGGPLIKFSGAPVPLPFITAGYGYGLQQNITVFANLHVTSLLFSNLQSDIGATFRVYEKPLKYGFSLSPALQVATSLKAGNSARLWPSLDANAYFHFHQTPSYLYAGTNAWFELSKTRAHGEAQPQFLIPNVQVGYVWVRTKWSHQFQLSYLGIGTAILPGVVDYIGFSGKGSLGLHYGLIRKF